MVCPTCAAIQALLNAGGLPEPLSHSIAQEVGTRVERKVKRKASAYSKKYGAAYKRLKKKHPRTSFGKLAKMAHRAVKKG